MWYHTWWRIPVGVVYFNPKLPHANRLKKETSTDFCAILDHQIAIKWQTLPSKGLGYCSVIYTPIMNLLLHRQTTGIPTTAPTLQHQMHTHRHTKRQTVRSKDVTVCQLSLHVNAVRINPFVAKKKAQACRQRDNVRMADLNSRKQRLCEIPFFSITNAELYRTEQNRTERLFFNCT